MQLLRRFIGDPDVAIDLGTANTRMFVNGHGLLADEPSVVRLKATTLGSEEIGVDLLPMRGGAVVDADAAATLLEPLVRRGKKFGLLRPRAIVTFPSDASDHERDLLQEAVRLAGVSSLHLAPEPLAAAIGCGLDITSSSAQMLLDIGDGVTDIAVIRSGELIATGAVRTACSDLHDAARKMLRDQYQLVIGRKQAEQLTHEFGASLVSNDSDVAVSGTHRNRNGCLTLKISAKALISAFHPPMDTILKTIKSLLDDLPDSIAADVYESGIHFTGGGACIKGLSDRIAQETGVHIHVVDDPLHAVINGSRQMLLTGIQTSLWQ